MVYNFPFEKADFFIKGKEIEPAESNYHWLISADKIFSSNIKDFTEFSRFFGMEFGIRRSSIYNEGKHGDSYVCGEEVKIYISPGRHCAILQSRLADKAPIKKIIVKKVASLNQEITVLEEKEYQNCSIQSFERKGENVAFTFRYTAFSDSYTDFKKDGTKLGTSATSIDLVTWKVQEK